MLTLLSQSLQRMQRHYNEATGARNLLTTQRNTLQQKLDEVTNLILLREKAILLLTKTAEVARGALINHIDETVTAPLQGIWGDDRYFRIKQYIHNSKTQEAGADFKVWKPTGEGSYGQGEGQGKFVPVHPYSASGGGLGDVVSAVLQMTLLEISKPRPGGPMCLDEPSKCLDNVKDSGEEDDNIEMLAQKQEALAEFIRAYAESSGRQVLLSSHNATLISKAHKRINVVPVNAVTCEVREE